MISLFYFFIFFTFSPLPESFPQLILQSVLLFLQSQDEGCFPALNVTSCSFNFDLSACKIYKFRSNGSLELSNRACNQVDILPGAVTCSWERSMPKFDFIISIVTSLVALSFSSVRYGPIAWIEEESQLEDDDPIRSLAINKSRLTLTKVTLYLVGFPANVLGGFGFLYMFFVSFVPWISIWVCIFFLPLILLQITQPNWLAFMWKQIRHCSFRHVSGIARFRGAWWVYFIALSPVAYLVSGLPLSVWFLLTEFGVVPFSRTIEFRVSRFPHKCEIRTNGVEQSWRDAITQIYPECVKSNGTDRTNMHSQWRALQFGRYTDPFQFILGYVQIAGIFLSVIYNILQMLIFCARNDCSHCASRCYLFWPFLPGILAIIGESLGLVQAEFRPSSGRVQAKLSVPAVVLTILLGLILVGMILAPLFLLCRKCCSCCCRPCCPTEI